MLLRRLLPNLFLAGAVIACSEDSNDDSPDAGDTAQTDAGAVPHDDDASGPAALSAEYVLSSEDSVPEGITFDPEERAFFVGSLNGGGITRVGADGTETELRAADGGSVAGLKVDADARRLWACASSEVLVYDLATSQLTHTFPLSEAAEGATCNDVTVDGSGRAYLTDSAGPNIYTVHVDEPSASLFATDPRFDATTLGLNGIELNAAGDALLVAKFLAGKLFRVALSSPTEIIEVELTGAAFSAPDGLAVLDGNLYSVSDAELKRVVFENDQELTGEVTVSPFAEGGLSTATVAEGQLYAVKSETVNFVVGEPLNLPFKIVRIDLNSFE